MELYEESYGSRIKKKSKMPMIIGIYVAIPFISYLVENFGKKFLLIKQGKWTF